VLGMAALYYLAGRLALLLAIPGGRAGRGPRFGRRSFLRLSRMAWHRAGIVSDQYLDLPRHHRRGVGPQVGGARGQPRSGGGPAGRDERLAGAPFRELPESAH
jgi:hypothetical protein